VILITPRLILRSWRDGDIAPFAHMSADPEVMAFFERPLSAAEAEALVRRVQQRESEDGFCMWALELPGLVPFIGFAGIQRVPFEAPFAPAVEIGWRLARAAWGHGFATEAARGALAYAFGPAGLDEIVAMAVPSNHRSLAVMQRIGMQPDPRSDFDHPGMPQGHPLQRHLLYRIGAAAYRAEKSASTSPAS
jgi:ribosomal-protein-alanine N-acetyltransferase